MRIKLFSLSMCLLSWAIPIAAHAETNRCSETDQVSLRAAKDLADRTNAAHDEVEKRHVMTSMLADKIHITHFPLANPNIPSGRGEHVWTRDELVAANVLESDLMVRGHANAEAAAGLTIISRENRALVDGSCVVMDSVTRATTRDGKEVLSLSHQLEEIKNGKIAAITNFIPTNGMGSEYAAAIAASPELAELRTRMRKMLGD